MLSDVPSATVAVSAGTLWLASAEPVKTVADPRPAKHAATPNTDREVSSLALALRAGGVGKFTGHLSGEEAGSSGLFVSWRGCCRGSNLPDIDRRGRA